MRSTTRVLGLGVALIFSVFSLVAGVTIANGFVGQTTRVSVSSTGTPASASATSGVLSADGRYVVFQSSASDLVSGVTGTHVYRHDRTTGDTVLVDVAKAGGASTGLGTKPTVSADGRYVAFSSSGSDLVDGDTNLMPDVFVRDMLLGTTALASATAAGVVGNSFSGLSGFSGAHEISGDGRFVVFTSFATNLVAAANNGVQQVYVKDMTTGDVVRASVNAAGDAGDLTSQTPAISGNGHVVAFNSAATNLGLSSGSQIFVRDLVANTTTLETAGAAAVAQAATMPTLSFDGRYLAFVTAATLDARDLDGGTLDVYLRDRVAGTTVLASLSPNALSGATSTNPSISDDGRWVGFDSLDDMMVASDTNRFADVFLYDRDTRTVMLVSLNDADQQANAPCVGASVSSDGHLVLFGSTATNLAAPSSVGNQLYVRNLISNQPPVLLPFGKDFVLSESQPMRVTWAFSDNDASTSWTATVDYGDGSGVQALALNADKTFVLSHLFVPGAYDVTVQVTDNAGAKGSLVIHVAVSNVAPFVSLPPTVNLAFTNTLDTSGFFTDPGSNETYVATVNYGDGTGTQSLTIGPFDASPLVGGSFALQHTYATAGSYNVAVIVADSNGGSTAANLTVNVGGFTFELAGPFTVGRNLPVKFIVRGPDGSAILDQTVQVDVIDAAGNVVAGPYFFGEQPSRSVMFSDGSYHVNVDTRTVVPGSYRLRVRFSSPTLTGVFTVGTPGSAAAPGSASARAMR